MIASEYKLLFFDAALLVISLLYYDPSCSERAASAFFDPAPAARMLGGFTPSSEAKCASLSGVPSPSHSERAASAFLTSQHRSSFYIFYRYRMDISRYVQLVHL